jgi:hypothetical protein
MRNLVLLAVLLALTSNTATVAQTTTSTNQGKPADKGTPSTDNSQSSDRNPPVFASLSDNRLRFSALGQLLELRLEVINPSGQPVFDSDFKSGNVVDWLAADQNGQPLPEGSYLCLITVKDSTGRLTKHRALLVARNQTVSLRQSDNAQLAPAQVDAVGQSSDEQGHVTLVETSESTATALIAHDGNVAHLVSGSGGLAISGGNFFANRVMEHIRLTAEGNLGIGVANPQARLDVAGRIRASEGIIFPDGSVQFSASSRTYGAASQRPSQPQGVPGQENPNVVDISGTGTTGRLSKWLDGPNGVLNDSNITEVSGAIGINAPPDTRFRLDVNGSVRFRGSNPGFNLEGARPAGNIWLFQTVDDDGRFRVFGQDNVNPGVERLTIKLDTGFVGLGATSPAARLHALGTSSNLTTPIAIVESSGTQIPLSFRMAGVEQARVRSDSAGNLVFATINGTAKDIHFRVGDDINTAMIIQSATGNVGIGTTGPATKLDITGAGIIRARVNSDINAGVALTLNNQPKWSVATVTGGQFQIFNDAIGLNALWIDSASNNLGIGTTAPSQRLHVAGNGLITGNLTVNGTITGSLAASSLTGTVASTNGGTGLSSSGAAGNYLRSNGGTWTSSPIQAADLPSLGMSYIQNSSSPQASSNFNISGDGTAAGTLNANAVNATSQYNLGGSRVLALNSGLNNLFIGLNAGAANPTSFSNTFVGHSAGQMNTSGTSNSFFGHAAGQANVSGSFNAFFGSGAGTDNTGGENAFFGYTAGRFNTSGSLNSFFGKQAGLSNTTGSGNSYFGEETGFYNTKANHNTFIGLRVGMNTGQNDPSGVASANTFVGSLAGQTNDTGSNNTVIGAFADVASNNLTNATAIGMRSQVSQSNSLVLGSISGVNGAAADTKVGIGTTAPAFKLQVIDPSNTGLRVQTNTGGGTVASFGGAGAFQIDSNGTAGGRFQVAENGNVGIGTNTPNDRLEVSGILRVATLGSSGSTQLCRNASNQISGCSSSIRYKSNIANLHTGLSLINRLRPVTFDWKQSGETDLGLVAEEVAKVEPLLVTHNEKGEVEGVKYDRVGVVLINAVKEQQQQISRQQTEIDRLKRIIEQQKERAALQRIAEQQAQIEGLQRIVCLDHPKAEVCKATRRAQAARP